MWVDTDSQGCFIITPLQQEGYNVMQPSQYEENSNYRAIFQFPINHDDDNSARNAAFQQMRFSQALPLSEIYHAPETRLWGVNRFIAKDGSGNPVVDSKVRVLIVVWDPA